MVVRWIINRSGRYLHGRQPKHPINQKAERSEPRDVLENSSHQVIDCTSPPHRLDLQVMCSGEECELILLRAFANNAGDSPLREPVHAGNCLCRTSGQLKARGKTSTESCWRQPGRGGGSRVQNRVMVPKTHRGTRADKCGASRVLHTLRQGRSRPGACQSCKVPWAGARTGQGSTGTFLETSKVCGSREIFPRCNAH